MNKGKKERQDKIKKFVISCYPNGVTWQEAKSHVKMCENVSDRTVRNDFNELGSNQELTLFNGKLYYSTTCFLFDEIDKQKNKLIKTELEKDFILFCRNEKFVFLVDPIRFMALYSKWLRKKSIKNISHVVASLSLPINRCDSGQIVIAKIRDLKGFKGFENQLIKTFKSTKDTGIADHLLNSLSTLGYKNMFDLLWKKGKTRNKEFRGWCKDQIYNQSKSDKSINVEVYKKIKSKTATDKDYAKEILDYFRGRGEIFNYYNPEDKAS